MNVLPRTIHLFGPLLAGALTLAACSQPAPSGDDPATSENGPLKVHILGFNDFHGHLESPAGELTVDGEEIEAGGAAQLAHRIETFRNEHEHTAVVVAGDLIGASPLVSALLHDEPTIDVMNEIGLDAVAVGNHEFDEGWRELIRIQEGGCHPEDGCRSGQTYQGAKFPFLAANVLEPDGETLFPPYVVKQFGSVKVGILGLALDGIPAIVMPSGIEGLTFRDEAETINEYVPELQELGVETIIVVVHEGGNPTRERRGINDCPNLEGPIVEIVEKSNDAVDGFMTGHTHQTYNCTIDGKLVTSAKSYGRLVTEYELAIDPKTGDVVEQSAENVPIPADAPTNDEVARLVGTYSQLAAREAEEPVGHITDSLSREPNEAGESALGAVIADSQYAATAPEGSGNSDLAFMNPGGIRTSLDTADGEDGENGDNGENGVVTYGDLHEVQPFRNQVVVMTFTGKQIHRILERQWEGQDHPRVLQVSHNVSYTWHPDREPGNRVDPTDVTIDGKPLDLEESYRVTINNFLAEGGDNFDVLADGRNPTYGPIDIEILADYFRKNSPVSPPDTTRIKRADE